MPTGLVARACVRRARMTPEREVELLDAALDVLREVGYASLTMDAVAARARCSKATLYRQWQSKPELVVAALRASRPVGVAGIDTGSLRGDLLALAGRLSACAEQDTALVTAFSHASLTDKPLVRAVREALIEPEIAQLTALVERAVARGELPKTPAATAYLPQMLFSAVVSRPLFEDTFADAEYLARFIEDALLPALTHS